MMNDKQLYDLLDTRFPENVMGEVQTILRMISTQFDLEQISGAFNTTVRLYEGSYPGFKACNTEYHDIRHTTETFLAMARLLHGAHVNNEGFTERHITLALIAALFHDSGYIQEAEDEEGTGAKYTVHHEERSARLLEQFAPHFGLSRDEITEGRIMILCTDIGRDLRTLSYPSHDAELLAMMLTASDLMAQMADRSYLEKLLFLYHEFKEANVGRYKSEVDLLKETLSFYDFVADRLQNVSDRLDRFMTSHFTLRWGIPSNLYQVAIKRQKGYLQRILRMPNSDPRNQLKRGGIVKKVREKYREND